MFNPISADPEITLIAARFVVYEMSKATFHNPAS
jgi:hypothetical protein